MGAVGVGALVGYGDGDEEEREIVYYYRRDPHEHILRGDDKAPGGKIGLHMAAT